MEGPGIDAQDGATRCAHGNRHEIMPIGLDWQRERSLCAPAAQATATAGGLIQLAGAVGVVGSAAPPSARRDFSGPSLGGWTNVWAAKLAPEAGDRYRGLRVAIVLCR